MGLRLILRYCLLSLPSYIKSPPFSFQVDLAPLFHGRSLLVETDERSVTTFRRPKACGSSAFSSYVASIIRLPNRRPVGSTHPLHWLLLPLLSTQHGVLIIFWSDGGFEDDDVVSIKFFFLLFFLIVVCYFYFISIQCRWARAGTFLL
jgi:hypothetical protein